MSNVNWQDVADRAAWTFGQSFLAVLVASGTGFVDGNVWKSAAVGGAAAVFSFLKNVAFSVKGGNVPPDPGA